MTSIFAQAKAPTSLFGQAPNATQSKGLFGASTNTTQPTTGLFGASQPAQNTGLFGASNTQAQPAGPSLFGAQPQAQSTGLFGAQPQPTQNTGLFGAQPQAQPQQSLFGQPQPQAQNNNFAGSLGQGLYSAGNAGALTAQTQHDLAQSRLQSVGLGGSLREKSVSDQLMSIASKWNPASSETLIQTYLYNAANPAFAPFYHPADGETEKDYETALANKPEPVEGNTWVPVLIRGMKSLGDRAEYQAKFVQSMQMRLHEMNNALTAIMQKHTQDLSVRIDATKRQHAAISARTLRLAVKCQVLRNRGYALDSQEESLCGTLLELDKKVQDPVFTSREEEIWARMVILRQRTQWLEEEGKRLGNSVDGQPQAGQSQIPSDVIESAKRILRDYDAQIQQLSKEVNEVQKEYAEWNENRPR